MVVRTSKADGAAPDDHRLLLHSLIKERHGDGVRALGVLTRVAVVRGGSAKVYPSKRCHKVPPSCGPSEEKRLGREKQQREKTIKKRTGLTGGPPPSRLGNSVSSCSISDLSPARRCGQSTEDRVLFQS